MEFTRGQKVSVLLSEKHEIDGADKKKHPAKFVGYHLDRSWADVDLDEYHTAHDAHAHTKEKNLNRLSVPVSIISAVLLLAALFAPETARAQFIGYTSPQTVTAKPINGQNCLNTTVTSTNSAIPNLGQSFHYVSYSITTAGTLPVVFTLALQGSYDGVVFFPISDQATWPANGLASQNGQLEAFGQFPVYQVTASCQGGSGAQSLTVNYSGTSVSSSLQFSGLDQTIYRKPVFLAQPANATNNSGFQNVTTPFGNTNGVLVCIYGGAAGPAGSTVQVTATDPTNTVGSSILPAVTLQTTIAVNQLFPLPNIPASNISVTYTSGGASAATLGCSIYFYKPGVTQVAGYQPGVQSNTEQTAVNASVTKTITGTQGSRAHLFSVSARCSAGTAGLTVADGATTIWSTSATEVGVTTFRYQWAPGLAATFGNNLVITLTTCGAANTGTLDVQTSQF